MANDVTLSKGVRANLLSLQSTAEMMAKVQERLSTGKKVNSALDNPVNFFTAAGLNARANDLSTLLDAIGNGVQTLAAADKGITAISKLVESLKSTAKQAVIAGEPTNTYATAITGGAIADDVAAEAVTGDLSALNATGGTITINGENVVIAAADGEAEALTALQAAATANGTFVVVDNGDNTFTITANAGADLEVGGDATTLTELGLTAGTTNANADLGALTGDVTFQLGTGSVATITFGTGSGEVNSRAELSVALAAAATTSGLTLAVNGSDQISVTSTSEFDVTIGGSPAVLTALGLSAGSTTPTATLGTPNATRASLQTDYNSLLTQITQLAQDASFNGVNLLNEDNLTVTFNEDGSSALVINGVDFTAAGLGLTPIAGDGFQIPANVTAALAQLDAATATLRSQASAFGSNLSIVQARQDFTKNLINVLEIGADNLTLADTNEEGANLLALQTRQSLSTTSLSMAAQADQNVLRLFQ